jgi:hypothetical protein
LHLRGADIVAAELWRDRRPPGAPELTASQGAFISASRSAAVRRQRFWLFGSLSATAGFALLAFLAWQQRNEALATESRFLADSAQGERQTGNASKAVALSYYALPHHLARPWERPLIPQAYTALYEGMLSTEG